MVLAGQIERHDLTDSIGLRAGNVRLPAREKAASAESPLLSIP